MIKKIKCKMPNRRWLTVETDQPCKDLRILLDCGWHFVARNADTAYLLAVFP